MTNGAESPGKTVKLPSALEQLAAPPLFVVGAHRSGTTWVFEMLSAHPRVAGVFESGMFAADIGIAPILGPKHWYDEKAMDRDREFFGRPFRLAQLMAREAMIEDLRNLTGSWLARALSPDDLFLVEKTPQHAAVIPTLSELFPGSKVLHVVRDGRDVVVSAREAARNWPQGRIRSFDSAALARHWVETVRTARRFGKDLAGDYCEVRYEDLHANPSSIEAIFDWAGIEASRETIDQIVKKTKFPDEQGAGPTAFRRKGRVGDWRTSLGLRERLAFERAAGATLRELGYEARARWWLRPSLS